MIPCGLYLLTGKAPDGQIAAATVSWGTQASCVAPLIALGAKTDSGAHAVIQTAGAFALNVLLGKDQGGIAYAFFGPTQAEPGLLSGQPYRDGGTGAPVTDAVVHQEPTSRADDATLWMKDLGEKVFYGG